MRDYKRWFLAILCICLSACGTSSALVTMSAFQDIPTGASTSEVEALLGEPYAIRKQPDGSIEYEYIERFQAGVRNFEQRHYFLVFKDGKLVSRKIKTTTPPPYRFDSYDMQTTQSQTHF